jgi:alkylation response protein AidB-like acyl-CoA dehydrogenase
MKKPSPSSQPGSANHDLAERLAAAAAETDIRGAWPKRQLDDCGEHGVMGWFVPAEYGGRGYGEAEIVRGLMPIAGACMTTTFALTQFAAACARIAASSNEQARRELLPGLAAGRRFATVGISHLTTSRRHLARPVLAAEESRDGVRLAGYTPWVTGAAHADVLVVGATLGDGRQLLAAVPADSPGVRVGEPFPLVSLTGSRTGPVHFDGVLVDRKHVLAGPVENVMQSGSGGRTGGLQTSALAVGLADAAIRYLEEQSRRRDDLIEAAGRLRGEHDALRDDLIALAEGEAVCTSEDLRARANSFVLRATQAALAAAKGAGFVASHACGRWCREALFFLVWSCPQPVMAANLCELAGIGSDGFVNHEPEA